MDAFDEILAIEHRIVDLNRTIAAKEAAMKPAQAQILRLKESARKTMAAFEDAKDSLKEYQTHEVVDLPLYKAKAKIRDQERVVASDTRISLMVAEKKLEQTIKEIEQLRVQREDHERLLLKYGQVIELPT